MFFIMMRLQSFSDLLYLLARVAAMWIVWQLVSTTETHELLARKLVLCFGLWHLSSRKESNSTDQALNKAKTTTRIPKPQTCQKRRVSFGELEILEFPSLLGDNPSVKEGAPLTLDWKPVRKSIKQVDLVADRRGPHRAPRALSPSERELLLLSKGYTLLEIAQASSHHNSNRHNNNNRMAPRDMTPFLNFKNRVRNLVNRRASLVVGRTS